MHPLLWLGIFGAALAALINELNPENGDRESGRAPPKKRKAKPPPPDDDDDDDDDDEVEEPEGEESES